MRNLGGKGYQMDSNLIAIAVIVVGLGLSFGGYAIQYGVEMWRESRREALHGVHVALTIVGVLAFGAVLITLSLGAFVLLYCHFKFL